MNLTNWIMFGLMLTATIMNISQFVRGCKLNKIIQRQTEEFGEVLGRMLGDLDK